MHKLRLTVLFGLCVALFALPAGAQTLWYNGDFDNENGLTNERNTYITDACVYDDFIIPSGETWNITSLFSNNLMDFRTGIADWEIRQGVSAGNGGTLLYSGTDVTVNQIATGRSDFGYEEYTIETAVSLTLGPGTYWLCVRPVDSGGSRSFISTTSGANAIGSPAGNDGNSFLQSSFFSVNFIPTSNMIGTGNDDFSMGVRGTVDGSGGDVVPEPGSLALFLSAGVTGSLTVMRRRIRSKSRR